MFFTRFKRRDYRLPALNHSAILFLSKRYDSKQCVFKILKFSRVTLVQSALHVITEVFLDSKLEVHLSLKTEDQKFSAHVVLARNVSRNYFLYCR